MSGPKTEFIDPATLDTWLREGGTALFDVREEDEFAQARIAGSRLVPLSRFDPAASTDDGGARTVLHSSSGRRRGPAAEPLRAAGDRPALSRPGGGCPSWARAGP